MRPNSVAIGLAVLVAALLGAAQAQAITTTHDVDAGGVIIDSQTFTFTVSGIGDLLTDVDVRVAIAHSYDADLDAALESPVGTLVKLFSNVGGDGDDFQDTLFDDAAGTDIGDGSPPFLGSYRPQALLGAYNGENPNGIWTLHVTDTFPALDSGYLYRSGDDGAPWAELIGAQLIISSEYSQQRELDLDVIATPEPTTIALGSLGIAALGVALRRRRA